MIKKNHEEIFREYESCIAYNNSIGLYDTVRQNERFYLGNQWEGLNAPDLDKPVLNFLKRVATYMTSMLVSDDITVRLRPFAESESAAAVCTFLEKELMRVIERTKAKTLGREVLRNCVVDGDGSFFLYFDSDAPTAQAAKGEIALELLENTKVLFGNPYCQDVQKQPYIIIVKSEQRDAVVSRARRYGGDADAVVTDSDSSMYGEEHFEDGLCTVLLKLYKQDGTVRFIETTRSAVVRGETDTGLRLYPVSYMSFEKIKNSYHGQAALTGLIPNQIAVNKLWAMAIRHQHLMAFPKVFYDRRKISEWSNRVGEAVGVFGNPQEAVASSFRPADMSAQLIQIVDRTITYTKELMGASDAALGTVRPDNTSAIIAVQKAAAAPLELQRLAFFQFVEDYVRIILDMVRASYGIRTVTVNGRQSSFDYSAVDYDSLELAVEVGSSAYWSEMMQVQTLDNMFSKGVIDDAVTYLESLPDRYLVGKRELIGRLKSNRETKGAENAL